MNAMARTIVIFIVVLCIAGCNILSTVVGVEFVSLSRQPHPGLELLNWLTGIASVLFTGASVLLFFVMLTAWHDQAEDVEHKWGDE